MSWQSYIVTVGYKGYKMKKDWKYWSEMDNTKRFYKGLCRVPRDYYLGIAKHYLSRTILDLGCGLGDTYNLFKKYGIEVDYVGLDVCKQFIEICKRRYPDAVFSNAPIENIPYPDNSFEMVTCRAVLEHLPDPEPAIREMARVSSETVVIVWSRHPGKVKKIRFKEEGYHINDYPRDEILELTDSAGLRLEDEFTEGKHLVWVLEKK